MPSSSLVEIEVEVGLGRWLGGWLENWRVKLISTQVAVEVEVEVGVELGNEEYLFFLCRYCFSSSQYLMRSQVSAGHVSQAD